MPSETAKESKMDELTMVLQGYDDQLSALDARLQELEEQNRGDEAMAVVKKYQHDVSNDNILIDDALDRVIHLETELKILRQRNKGSVKGTHKFQQRLNKTANNLQKMHDELEMVVDATGWHEGYVLDRNNLTQCKKDVHEMSVLETKLRHEIKNAEKVNNKKQDTLSKLRQDVEKIAEKQNELNDWYNQVRVQQRENAAKEARLAALRKEDEEISRALVVIEERSNCLNGSALILEADKAYLNSARKEMQLTISGQRRLTRAEQVREDQLRKRLAMLMSCLKDLKLEKAFNESAKSIDTNAIVKTREAPQQLSDIIPEQEEIPIDSFRLVYFDNENLKSSSASKGLLALERESVVCAMEAQLIDSIRRYNSCVDDIDVNRLEKASKAQQLIQDIQNRHQQFRRRMEDLTKENTRLRNELAAKRRESKK